jgi:hypothetical protein
MKFEVAKREVDVRWPHVWFVIGMMFAIVAAFAILAIIATGLVSLSSGAGFSDSYPQALALIGTLLALVTPALTAFAYVSALPYFKLKKDVAACRSVSASQFILVASMTIVLMVMTGFLGQSTIWIMWPIRIIAQVAVAAEGAILFYLWMLIFLKNDVEGVKKSALPATLAAVAITAVGIIAPYAMAELFGLGYIPAIDLAALRAIINNLWFALPLIMFMPKKLDDASYLFSGLFLCGAVLGAFSVFFMSGGGISNLAINMINDIAMLGIVYIAGTYGRK